MTRRDDLVMLRAALLDALDEVEPKDVAALSRELRMVTAELADQEAPQEVSPLDELAARRAGLTSAEGAPAAGGGQNRRR